jgi:hypothetical protein
MFEVWIQFGYLKQIEKYLNFTAQCWAQSGPRIDTVGLDHKPKWPTKPGLIARHCMRWCTHHRQAGESGVYPLAARALGRYGEGSEQHERGEGTLMRMIDGEVEGNGGAAEFG